MAFSTSAYQPAKIVDFLGASSGSATMATGINGRGHWVFDISGTSISSTDEAILDMSTLPAFVTLVYFEVAGDAATLMTPRIGTAAGFTASTIEEKYVNATSVAKIMNVQSVPFVFSSRQDRNSRYLYVRPAPASTINVRMIIAFIDGCDTRGA